MKRRRERKIDPKDEQKLSFIMEHFQKDSPFDVKKELDVDVQSALQWIGQRSAEQVRAERERITSDIERQGARMWESGACDAWLNKCSHGAIEVVKGVNGPMFSKLATSVAFDDMQAIEAFREGAAFFAVLVFVVYAFGVCVGRSAILWNVGQMQPWASGGVRGTVFNGSIAQRLRPKQCTAA
jgi:hypothetical protein